MTTDIALKGSLFFVSALTDYLDRVHALIPEENWAKLQQEIESHIQAIEAVMRDNVSDKASFVNILTDYLDRAHAFIPEEDWAKLQQEIEELIQEVESLVQGDALDEAKARVINFLVDYLFDAFMETPAETLVRVIEKTTREKALTRHTGTLSVTVAGDTRQVATGLGKEPDQSLTPETLLAAFALLSKRLNFVAEPFSAYPRLDAPAEVEPEAIFEVVVGFRAEADPSLDTGEPIVVDNPDLDKSCLVILRAEGADVIGDYYKQLALKQDTAVIFTCRAHVNVAEILLSVDYFYDNQPIGLAQRRVRLSTAPPADDNPDDAEVETMLDPMRLPDAAQYVDLNLIIHKIGPKLSWELSSHHLGSPPIIITTELSDPRQFCANLLTGLKTENSRGALAYNILTNIGRKIADEMPSEFFETLQAVYQVIKRIPTLLILTNEPYIPWELALLDDPLDPDPTCPSFLSTQSIIGRWIYHKRVPTPPPVSLHIAQTTVAASDYSDSGQLGYLNLALQEQADLVAYFHACGLAVTELEMTHEFKAFLSRLKGKPGHLLHIAAHGLVDLEANEEYLFLAGNRREKLLPSAMVPALRKKEPPHFTFVFLNACQVGIAGEALGQAAGFPGDLICNGVQGFIAPLWEIHGKDAYHLAKAFYLAAVDQATPLAEFLYKWRHEKYKEWLLNNDKEAGSTTPMAYIFYGHPRLRLEVSQNSSPDSHITGEPE